MSRADDLDIDAFLRTVDVTPCRGLDVTVGFSLSDAPSGRSRLVIELFDGQVSGVAWRSDGKGADVWVSTTYQQAADYLLGRSSYQELLTEASLDGEVMAFIAVFGVVASEAWQDQGASWRLARSAT